MSADAQLAEMTEAASAPPRPQLPQPVPALRDASTSERTYNAFGPRMRVLIILATPHSSRVYVLRTHLTIRLSYQLDGIVFASHASLPVHGYGSSETEAIASFADSFDWQWQHLANATDDVLTVPARAARDALRASVEHVRE